MNCIIILLLSFLSPAGKSLPTENETLDAEEHSNATLTWIHFAKTTTDRLHINLRIMELEKSIYQYDSRSRPEPYINDQFRGRLLCDLQLDGEGQLLCVLTDLRLNDTGWYQLFINGECHKKKYQLTVRGKQ
uniref:Immunoglobulin V-set domain-containing protein n=1 Tax=Poecilia formosa TaxID=48698 RepID=A0A096LW89_POEFO